MIELFIAKCQYCGTEVERTSSGIQSGMQKATCFQCKKIQRADYNAKIAKKRKRTSRN